MSDQSRPAHRRPYAYESTPAASCQIVKFLTAGAISASLLVLSGLTLTGTTIALVIATPLLVIFSPVIVPAGIVLFLVALGFFLSGGFGVSGITALTWLYRYVRGEHPPGADQLDYSEGRLAETARDMKERAKEYGQQKAQEATQTHTSP